MVFLIIKIIIVINNEVTLTAQSFIKLSQGACGVMAIVAGYGHGDTSSNPGPDWLHFT